VSRATRMALKVDRGLFSSDFIDHHAVLGISVEADSKIVRKRYLKIARRLHPDSSAITNDDERQLAKELLSKLVNPAYEKLSNKQDEKEYKLLLDLKGKQLNQQQDTVVISCPLAQKLAGSGNIKKAYEEAVESLSEQQYESLSECLEITGQISELNMVYLMRRQGGKDFFDDPGIEEGEEERKRREEEERKRREEKEREQRKRDLVERAIGRAKEKESRGDFSGAIRELREAIQMNPLHPKVATCHSRLANLYLNIKQPTMAKIHARKALETNPQDELARAILDRLEGKNKKKEQQPQKGKSGIFSGLFGGKKK